jgi:hypothetical protein
MIASGLSMYLFSRALLGRAAALAASVIYMAGPYHFFELYRVTALSEFWSFAWLPLILHSVRLIASGRGWRASAYLAVSYGLLLFTHVPISFIVTILLPFYVLALTRQRRKHIQVATGVFLGVGLSAVFLVSVWLETKYVRIERILENSYKETFLFEDFRAFSLSNLLSTANYPHISGYVQEANLVGVGLLLLLVVVSVILLVEWRSIQRNRAIFVLVRTMWLIAGFSLLISSRLSAPIWDAIRSLQYLQSPIRWLVPASAAIALLTGASVHIARASRYRAAYFLMIGITILLNILVIAHVATQSSITKEELAETIEKREVPEYSPLWWNGEFSREFENTAVVVSEGEAEVISIDDAGLKQSYQVNAKKDAVLKFRSVYFPGWTARIDGRLVDLEPSVEGNMRVDVPAGSHTVSLEFGTTWRHIKASIVSAVSLLVTSLLFIRANYAVRTEV